MIVAAVGVSRWKLTSSPITVPIVPIASAATVVPNSVEPTSRAVAAGITMKLDTRTTPTVFTDTTTTTAVWASSRYSSAATGTPEIAASSGSKIRYARRDHNTTVTPSATTPTTS